PLEALIIPDVGREERSVNRVLTYAKSETPQGRQRSSMTVAICDSPGYMPPKKRAAGFSPPPSCVRPKALLALWLAFLVCRRQRRRPDIDRTGLRRRGVGHRRGEPISRHRNGGADHAARHVVLRAEVAGVLHRVGEIRLFSGNQVAQIRLHRREIRLLLRVRVL